METKSRQEVFEEKLKRYRKIVSTIESIKEDDPMEAARIEGIFMLSEMEDIKDFLGDKARGTKLFTIGANNMTRADLKKEMDDIRSLIENIQSSKDKHEFSEDVYDMLDDECLDVYGKLDLEKQIDEEKYRNFTITPSNSKFGKDKVEYANRRRDARNRQLQIIKSYEKQKEINARPELVDPKAKFRDDGRGRG